MDEKQIATDSVVPETPLEETTAEEPIQLSVQDLAAVVSVIDLAVQRGAFRAHEISQVGAVFDKVSKFVNTINKSQESQEPHEGTQENT